MPVPGLSLAISLFFLTLASRPALAYPAYISYDTLFFAPTQVLDNAWFNQSKSAQGTAADWANQLMESGPWSVTNKTHLPKSGDPHDYYSLAVYWWPDCSRVNNTTQLTEQQVWDECTYVRRDGDFNPDIFEIQNLEQTFNVTDSVYLSALAYVATGSPFYSSQINSAIYTFFVNETTLMNPNLNYAQVIRGPGKQLGDSAGVLDMETIAKIASGVAVMRMSGAAEWKYATDVGLVNWAKEMVNWLTTNEAALGEKNATNNHGTYYLNQLCSLYILLNDSTSAISQLESFYNSTFLAQIAANGDQPLESSRTRPYHYRAYNLAALVVNAQIGDYFGLSPSGWNRTTSSGATILDAVTYAIAQNADSEPSSLTELNPIVAAVASKFGDPNGSFAAFLAKTDPQYMAQPYYALASGLGGSGLQANATSTSPNPANTNAPPLYVKDNAADHFAAPFSICRAVVTGLAVILGIALAGGILF